MCGLAGVISKAVNGFTDNDMNALHMNMFLNQLRGTDSTGMFSVSNKGVLDHIKAVGPLSALLREEKWEGFKAGIFKTGSIAVGHGRYATRGKTTMENAHPFIVGKENKVNHLCLVHNGTLDKWQNLPGIEKHDVDSNWLAECISKYGPEEALGKINGAIACIWWDTELNRLNMYRNEQRPLHIAVNDRGNIYLNSEFAPLLFLRHKLNLGYNEKDILQFIPNTLCSISLDNLDKFKTIDDLDTLKIKRIPAAYYGGTDNAYKYTPPARNLLEDARDILARLKGTIKFVDGLRKTQVISHNQNYISQETCAPYIEGLVEMGPSPDEKYKVRLTCTSAMDGKLYWTDYAIAQVEDLWKKELERRAKEKKEGGEEESPVLFLPNRRQRLETNFRAGQGSRFRTRMGNVEIRHKVLCTKGDAGAFEKYENTVDGKFTLGQRVVMEVYSTITRSNVTEVQGFLVDPEDGLMGKQSTSVDIYFFESKLSAAEINHIGIFSGEICRMSPNSLTKAAQTGAPVEFYIKDVKPHVMDPIIQQGRMH